MNRSPRPARPSRAMREAMRQLERALTWAPAPSDPPLFLDELNRSPNIPRCARCGGPLGPVGECILCDGTPTCDRCSGPLNTWSECPCCDHDNFTCSHR